MTLELLLGDVASMTVNWALAARDGAILAVGACALLAGMLRFNPRLFLSHFPETLRNALPPKTLTEKRHSIIGAVLLFTWTIGTLVISTSMAEARGTTDWVSLALHAFTVGMMFNLADWLILDELWLGMLRPKWVVPAGIDPAQVPFEHGRHFRGFVRGTCLFAVIGAVIAAIVWLA